MAAAAGGISDDDGFLVKAMNVFDQVLYKNVNWFHSHIKCCFIRYASMLHYEKRCLFKEFVPELSFYMIAFMLGDEIACFVIAMSICNKICS